MTTIEKPPKRIEVKLLRRFNSAVLDD